MNTPAQSGLTEPLPTRRRLETLRGSTRTHLVLLRFSTISLTTAAVDNVIFYLMFHATGTILGSQAAARVISVSLNYRMVRQTVFFSDRRHRIALPRYILLAVANAAASYAGIRLLTAVTPLSVIASKIVAETLLFASNFVIQRAFIFTRRSSDAGVSGL